MRAINLKTEHMINPLGIDVREPYLTWNCLDGKRQSAYEIQILENDNVVCNSGKIICDEMYHVYTGGIKSRQRYTWKLRLWDELNQVGEWSKEAFFETGILEKNEWKAKWINPELTCDSEVHKPASYLRTSFHLEKSVFEKAKAHNSGRLYITAHGLYEAWINGKRVGDFVLAPGSYNYDKRLGYQTYDVYLVWMETEISMGQISHYFSRWKWMERLYVILMKNGKLHRMDQSEKMICNKEKWLTEEFKISKLIMK